MSDAITDIVRDNKMAIADREAFKARKGFEENPSIINADDLLTRLGKMKIMPRGYWESVDSTKINKEIEKYQNYLFSEANYSL